MAAAQVAKKLKDKRQKKTIEGIFNKVDKDGNGSISLSEYFEIFEKHGIEVNRTETNRVIKLAGEDGNLTKENFVKILKTSDFFMKSFDKNKDGVVTETDMMTRAELAFSGLDQDKSGYITAKELKLLSKKMSEREIKALMNKLDSDGDGQLSFEEFKVLFDNAEKRRTISEPGPHKARPKDSPNSQALPSAEQTPKQRRKGCSFRDKTKVCDKVSSLSLAGAPAQAAPQIIITKSSPELTAIQ